MAKPKTTTFKKFKVYLGNGASPEVFTAPAAFTQKALKLSKATSEAAVPDDTDPEAAPWVDRKGTSRSGQVTGSGFVAMADLAKWQAFFDNDASQNVRIEFDEAAADNGGYYQGGAVLTELSFDTALASDADKVKIQVTIDSDGAWAWTDASA